MVEENRTEDFENGSSQATNGTEGECTQGESIEDTTEPDEKSEVVLLNEKLEAAKVEAAENYDKFLRATAEFDNLRRRTEKERGDLLRFGAENLMKDLLPVMDSFEKALPENGNDESQNQGEFLKGIQLVWKQMSEVLNKNGLTAIEAKGVTFDPNYHQAIQRLESEDVDSEVIADEYQKGYLLHDRLLRPSISIILPKRKIFLGLI